MSLLEVVLRVPDISHCGLCGRGAPAVHLPRDPRLFQGHAVLTVLLCSVFTSLMCSVSSLSSAGLCTHPGERLCSCTLLHGAECFDVPWHTGMLQTCLWNRCGWCLPLECKDEAAMTSSWAIPLTRGVLRSWWDWRWVNLLTVDTHRLSLWGGKELDICVAAAGPLPQGFLQQTASPVSLHWLMELRCGCKHKRAVYCHCSVSPKCLRSMCLNWQELRRKGQPSQIFSSKSAPDMVLLLDNVGAVDLCLGWN